MKEVNSYLEGNLKTRDQIIESQNKFLLRLKSKVEQYKTETMLLKKGL